MAAYDKAGNLQFKLGAGVQNTLESWVTAQVCSRIDTAEGLSGATASTVPKNIKSVAFFWNDADSPGEVQTKVTYIVPGEWTPV